MASQSVIIPSDRSLFITDKSWLRPGTSSGPGQGNFTLARSSEIDGLSVTIAKIGIKSGKRGKKERWKADDVPKDRGLQFVNTTQSTRGKRDATELRRLVRSHVMTGKRRSTPGKPIKTPESNSKDGLSTQILEPGNDESFDEGIVSRHPTPSWPFSTCSDMSFVPSLPLLPSGTSTSLYGRTPFQIHPHFHRLMTYYSTETALTLYPLQRYLGFNPVQRFWFPMALSDEALLHTIMYSAALGLSRSPSPTTALSASHDLTQLVAPILRLLTSRLSNSNTNATTHPITDATIAAVSCLVMVENERGDLKKSLLHLSGLSQMVRNRGGLETISPGLVMKIARADSEGSVDNLTRPTLPQVKRLAPTLYNTLPPSARIPPSRTFMSLLSLPELASTPHLSSPLLALANFTTALNHYTSSAPGPHLGSINPRSYDEDLLSLSASLLSLSLASEPQPQTHTRTSPSSLMSSPTPSLTPFHISLQIASLIYTKSINRSLTLPPTSSQILSIRLHQSLVLLLPSSSTSSSSSSSPLLLPLPLTLWLLTMGGLASQPLGTPSKYFIDQLVLLLQSHPDLQTWERSRITLKEVLFVDVVHEVPCRKLWAQVLKMYELKRRWDVQVEMHW